MKKHLILFFGALLLVGIALFIGYVVYYQKADWKEVNGKDGIVNDYGLLEFYYEDKEIPENCNLIQSSNESYTINGITLKLVSYLFDGYQVQAVFEASGEDKKAVEAFGIDAGGEARNYQLISSRKLGALNEEKIVLGKKYFFWSCYYRPTEEKVICLREWGTAENMYTFHLQETTDKTSYEGVDYKVEMSPIGLYIYGNSSPYNLSYVQQDGTVKKVIEKWKVVDKNVQLFSEFSNDDVFGSYYGFEEIISVSDKKLISTKRQE